MKGGVPSSGSLKSRTTEVSDVLAMTGFVGGPGGSVRLKHTLSLRE